MRENSEIYSIYVQECVNCFLQQVVAKLQTIVNWMIQRKQRVAQTCETCEMFHLGPRTVICISNSNIDHCIIGNNSHLTVEEGCWAPVAKCEHQMLSAKLFYWAFQF